PASSAPPHPPSSPTRRSSDLSRTHLARSWGSIFFGMLSILPDSNSSGIKPGPIHPADMDDVAPSHPQDSRRSTRAHPAGPSSQVDRKSTRLNSSHVKTSYAVF